MPRRSIGDLLNDNKGIAPGFGLLRHVLAAAILIHHVYVLTFSKLNVGYEKSNLVANLTELSGKQTAIELIRPLLFSLVGGFFILSGFLVAGSAFRTLSVKTFLGFRALRIVPALFTEVMLSALVLGPLVTTFVYSAYFSDQKFYAYFLNIIGNVHYELPGVFINNPQPDLVNGNLWTLPAEFYCYAVMAIFMLSGLIFRRTLAIYVITIAYVLAIGYMWHQGVRLRADTTHYSSAFIVLLFYAGVAIYLAKDYIVLDWRLFTLSVLMYYIITQLNLSDPIAGLFLAYAIGYVGSLRFDWFDRNVKSDYSYGIYLYGYPLTQTWVYFLYEKLRPLGSISVWAIIVVLSFGSTLLMAKISWLAIEKPALKLKRFLVPRRREPVATPEPILEATKVAF